MTTKTYMTWMVALLVNSVLFGAGMATVLSVPSLAANASTLIPVIIAASLLFTWPIAILIAPRLRLRWHQDGAIRLRHH